jgi:phosphohistidine phosphatase
MLRLLLLRHAKAEPAGGKLEDHERPLSARGRADARRMGELLHERGYVPSLVLCSTSLRTRQTWEGVAFALGKKKPKTQFDRALYLAGWPQLQTSLKALPAKTSPVLFIGHNPGIEQLAFALALKPKTTAERARLENLAAKYPTAALAVLDLTEGQWSDAGPGKFRLHEFVKPKDIPGYGAEDD